MKDVVVVGGGPAGSVTAMLLARQGFEVTLLERQDFPRHKPCGDCLSPGANPVLKRLGVWEDVQRSAPAELRGWRLVAPGGTSFTTHFGEIIEGCESGIAISRDRFDAVLLDHARKAGVTIRHGCHVTNVTRANDGSVTGVAFQQDGQRGSIAARLTIGADGLRSVIARRLNAHARRPQLRKASFTMHVELPSAGDLGEMRILSDACLGIAPVTRSARERIHNVTLVLNRGSYNHRAGVHQIVSHGLRRFGLDSVAVDHVLTSGPFDWPTRRTIFNGAALVGDAAGYYDPFTGQGIYQALVTGEMLAYSAGTALRKSGQVSAKDLVTFRNAQRIVTRPARAVQRIIEFVCARPRLADRIFVKFAREESIARALIGVTADLIPPRRLLSPRLWARLAL